MVVRAPVLLRQTPGAVAVAVEMPARDAGLIECTQQLRPLGPQIRTEHRIFVTLPCLHDRLDKIIHKRLTFQDGYPSISTHKLHFKRHMANLTRRKTPSVRGFLFIF